MKTAPETRASAELSAEEATRLLDIAREALYAATRGDEMWRPALEELPERLCQPGATFVTLYTRGELHGCIGSIEPRLPLAHDVAKNAISAARRDPRFPLLRADEIDDTEIEISLLSPLQEVPYRDVEDLLTKIRPGEEGVLVERGWQRGLLLPQVWEKISDPREFLGHVALKAHATPAIYEDPDTRVYTFRVTSYTQPAPAEQHTAGRS
ncbi:MAG: AmmeMemoRadiSam system protein A [Caldilineae bacterium]|nr:MAG: AmmeMemoRadiSam system protein A [Caldilineae bacterium]